MNVRFDFSEIINQVNDGLNSGIMDGMSEKIDFYKSAKTAADQYEKIYHCTNAEAFVSIIKNKEFWLSNLSEVNDSDETKKIDDSRFKDKIFVDCFTYEDNIHHEHWKEYGADGVLFSVKKKWFEKKNAEGIEAGRTQIYSSRELAFKKAKSDWEKGLTYIPRFYIVGFSFLKVFYDDSLVIKMKEANSYYAVTFSPIAGILKNVKGLCERNGKPKYIKDWSDEKEIRLRVIIISDTGEDKILPFKKIAVKLTDDCFDELEIRFSPFLSPGKKEKIKKEVEVLLPNSKLAFL